MITAGSFSRLDVFEKCKQHARIKYVDKVPEPSRGKPHSKCPVNPETGEKEWHNDRGTRVHDNIDDFIKRKTDKLTVESRHFEEEILHVRELHDAGMVVAEEMWTYDDAWQTVAPTDYDNIMFRIKIDLTVFPSPQEVIIVDYKTGRRYGNEVKHAQQLQLYSVGTILRYPEVEHITVENWYLDQDEIADMHMTRKQAERFFKGWNNRMMAMRAETKFPPNPNAFSCKWCPYSGARGGQCTVGVF